MNIIEILNLPLYWDSAGFFLWEIKSIIDSNFTHLIPASSDYPHTPLLLIFYALVWKIFGYSRLILRLVSFLFSLIMLIVLYFFGKKFINKKAAIFAPLLLVSTPLFLAQTFMVYFEIPAALFKLSSFYFLFNHQFLAFFIMGLIASLIRLENFLFIPLVAVFYLVLSKFKSKFKFSLLILIIFGITGLSWLLIHYLKTGWFFYSPQRYFVENISRTFVAALKYILFLQGRIYLTYFLILIIIIMGFKVRFSLKKIKNKRFIIFLTLFFYAIIHLIFFSKLGYFLPRYILPLLPLYYLFFTALLFSLFPNKKIAIPFLVLLIFIFSLHLKKGGICNFEDSLRIIPHLQNRLKAIKFLENNAKSGVILSGEFPEHGELTLFDWGYTNTVFNVTTNPNIILNDNIKNLFVYYSSCESNKNFINNIQKKRKQFFLKEFDEGTIKILYRQ